MEKEEMELLSNWLQINPNDNGARARMENLMKMQQDSAKADAADLK